MQSEVGKFADLNFSLVKELAGNLISFKAYF